MIKPKELDGGGDRLAGDAMVRGEEVLVAGLDGARQKTTTAEKGVAVFDKRNSSYGSCLVAPGRVAGDIVMTITLF